MFKVMLCFVVLFLFLSLNYHAIGKKRRALTQMDNTEIRFPPTGWTVALGMDCQSAGPVHHPVTSDRGRIISHHRLDLCNAVELRVNRGQVSEKT
jgi:hypothetical protein